MSDPVEAAQRIAEQLEALGDAFGEGLWREMGRRGARKKEPPRGRGEGPRAAAVVGPPLDIYVTPQEVVVGVVLPGLTDPHQVTVGLPGPTELLIEAFLPDRLPDGMYIQRERFAGYCARVVTLPVSVRPAAAARYQDGVLELRFPRVNPGTGNEGVAVLHVPQHGG